jgi:hypothetical protein
LFGTLTPAQWECHRYRTTRQCRQWVVQVRGGVDGVLIGFVVRTAGADALPAVT